MAINIKFDLVGNPEPPTIILATRNGNKLGQLDVNSESIELTDRLNDASEMTFTLNKYVDGKITNLWDKVTDFKLVYCKEWDVWFEIKVELDEATETVKTVFCTQLGQAELSQLMLYNVEINTEEDIARDDYKITILWSIVEEKDSLLKRILRDKAPHYSVIHVDSTIANIQRSFSFNDISIYDAFQKISEEIGCLFVLHSNSDEDGNIQRTISVYDLQQNCLNPDCGYRGEFTDVCPKCGSTNIKYGYGEDTLIFVTADELASDGIQLTTDTDSVKNCFKLEAGDDLMTAAIRSCNPNGTDYIWRFSDDMKADMSKELVDKIESYDETYKEYNSNKVIKLDTNLLSNYNALVDKYSIYDKELQKINSTIIGYHSMMNAYYNTIDLDLYLKSSLMPSVEMSKTTAEEQGRLLTQTLYLSTVAVTNAEIVSLATADSTVLSFARTIVRPSYRVQIKDSSLSNNKSSWTGNFIITNYSDEEDTATSASVSVWISDDMETYVKQKIEKALNKENTDDLSITGLFDKDLNSFKNELKKYALNPLIGFKEACQACIDILIEQDIGSNTTSDLYNNLYIPYYNKLKAIESEILVREKEINIISGVYNKDGELVKDGLQNNIESIRNEIQDTLDFEKYLGEKLWFEFCSYRREDIYSNDNYISDGLNNAELFERALEFHEVAEKEIYKASELQHSISTTLNNLLSIPKFKSLVNNFKVGNWIRTQIDNNIFKLRLLEYSIDFGNFDNIPVEFSDVTKIKNGITDVESILSQASSMASSYGSVQRQASKGKEAQGTVNEWLEYGLNSAHVRIQNNNNEEIQMTKSGLICRTYDDVTETYSPEQLKLTHNIMAYTDDDWKTVKQAIGKHNYKYYNDNKELVEGTGYGVSATFITAGYVSGSQIIGGDIYSDNYSLVDRTGSYLNLRDGTFSFGGGALRFENGKLLISSPDIPTTETITEINEEWLKTTTVYAQNLQVNLAHVAGQLTADHINTTGLVAENISGTTLTGKTISGGSLLIGDKNGNSYVEITEDGVLNCKGGTLFVYNSGPKGGSVTIGSDGRLECTNANISGTIYANSGTIGGCSIDSSGHLQVPSAYITGKLVAGELEGQVISIKNYGRIYGNMYVGSNSEGSQALELDGNYGMRLISSSGNVFLQAYDGSYIRIGGDLISFGGTNSMSMKFFGTIYDSSGNVVTSDRDEKHDIEYNIEKYDAVFDDLKPVRFKYNDGTSDRYHTGLIANDVKESIEKRGIDTKEFAAYCEFPVYAEDEYGNLTDEIVDYSCGLRYEEFISLNIRQIQLLKERTLELEKKVELLTLQLSK